ncbi:hypothetical protein A2954_04500 [Candidatus Roizmanbacteria bacterium RIFCSPLOWO2_01_FULL_37_12]|uniref:Uncharacterized protein n=1 Tax=Candidatus Roizmanbacteria bacterium RIFCSPLOWO2_01_FULL_37_12 TaxID=1802056 RepID=A0A1F7IFW5_9BACT|nr:MAG: hypothetical protein A3D76_06440 [Candidatus Roizmanbacteria bacterium RIFCSPHIGHO2_02_FULL_37_9b]OGK42242.1 MAG: hypothetical protein A2954_04500 [Candidatus Roizmanbacteria bacterium RIFCSPLOWO2_01_FULL_37_12]
MKLHEGLSPKAKIILGLNLFTYNIGVIAACTPSQGQKDIAATARAGQGLVDTPSSVPPSIRNVPSDSAEIPKLEPDVSVSPDKNLNCETVEPNEGALAVIMRQRKEKTGDPYDSIGIDYSIKGVDGKIKISAYNYYRDPAPILQPGEELCQLDPSQ